MLALGIALSVVFGVLAAIGTTLLLNDRPERGPLLTDQGATAPATAPRTTISSSTVDQQATVMAKLEQRVSELHDELRQEQTTRLELQRRIAPMDERLEELEKRAEALTLELKTRLPDSSGTGSSASQGQNNTLVESDRRLNGGERRFGRQRSSAGERQEALVSAGLDVNQAAEIVLQQDQSQLARLELRDQAAREGWRDSDEFGERMQELRDQEPDLQAQLGDETYDRYLFASGRANRIRVETVINGSAASEAGIVAGDIIRSYAGSRVYDIRELQRATRAGNRFESVEVQLMRDGQTLDTRIERGPLGVTLGAERQSPDS